MATRPKYVTRPKGMLHCEGHLVEFRQGRACPDCSARKPLLVPQEPPALGSAPDAGPPSGVGGVTLAEPPDAAALLTQQGRIHSLALMAYGIGDRLDKEEYQALVCKRQLLAALGEEQRDHALTTKLEVLSRELAELREQMNRGNATGIEPPPAQDTTAAGRVH